MTRINLIAEISVGDNRTGVDIQLNPDHPRFAESLNELSEFQLELLCTQLDFVSGAAKRIIGKRRTTTQANYPNG